MTTRKENSSNDWYIYQYKDEKPSEVITYKKNLVEEIISDSARREDLRNQDYFSKDEYVNKFNDFLTDAKRAGYAIYRTIKL